MGTITVLNKHKLSKPDPEAHYIGRGSPLGNPYTVEKYGRHSAIKLYEKWLNTQVEIGDPGIVSELDTIANEVINTGHSKLICFCKPLACHGDVIAELVLKTIQEMNYVQDAQTGQT